VPPDPLKEWRVLAPAVVLTATFATWAADTISETSWLYALLIAVLGVADLPLVARARRRTNWALALLLHAGFLLLAWLVAFAVSAPFVRWE